GLNLSPSYRFSEELFYKKLDSFSKNIEKEPVDAVFSFENGKVVTFKPSASGISIDRESLDKSVKAHASSLISRSDLRNVEIETPIKIKEPEITTEKVNSFGIKELIGTGTSLFQHSIESRIFNINLAASRINGILIPPGETFSFVKTLGDVSAFTGYKQAYIIQNGRTVLGDGGGVCQVSTTLFRAILDSGMPIEERTAHSYRVQYYEQDSPPGLDATVFVPTVDLKFKNDTKHHILIQSVIDPYEQRLTFFLYGTKDGREVEITTPVVTSQTPPPEPKYEDDPNLPQGTLKQVDFAAWGAKVYFERNVLKDGKTIILDKFVSNYRPWQAVYQRGIKQ
ncbi:MAG: VanW family protein, partial [Patescibacteria group bacterium]